MNRRELLKALAGGAIITAVFPSPKLLAFCGASVAEPAQGLQWYAQGHELYGGVRHFTYHGTEGVLVYRPDFRSWQVSLNRYVPSSCVAVSACLLSTDAGPGPIEALESDSGRSMLDEMLLALDASALESLLDAAEAER